MNKHLETVLAFHKEIENGNVDAAMSNYVADHFSHHSTCGKADKAKATQFDREYVDTYTQRKFNVVRTICDGDEVFLHIRAILNDGG